MSFTFLALFGQDVITKCSTMFNAFSRFAKALSGTTIGFQFWHVNFTPQLLIITV
jgi:hypothetical protein